VGSVSSRLAIGFVFLAGVTSLRATPLVSLNGTLAGGARFPAYAFLPSALADLALLMGITGEAADQTPDRSIELALSGFEDDGESGAGFSFAPLVVGPHMISSIQLSFNPRLDLAQRHGRNGVDGAFDSRRQIAGWGGFSRIGASAIDNLQFELSLGAATGELESEKTMSERSMGKRDYVSFALVNQVHLEQRLAAEPEPAEEKEDSSFE
jgi:hypothetical protein